VTLKKDKIIILKVMVVQVQIEGIQK